VELARDLLTRFVGLRGVMDATPDQFAVVPGMGLAMWAQLQA
jgi:DNA repair protein RadC